MVSLWLMLFWGTTGVCLANIGLTLGLVFIYQHGYSQLKSRFGLGLLVFALLLMGQNILYIYFYFTEYTDFRNAMVYVMTAQLIQTLGLAALSWVSWR